MSAGCEECVAARESGGHHRRFDSLKCVYCAARLIQKIKRLGIGKTEASARCKAALAESVARGLDEKELRRLEAGPMAIAPRDAEIKGKKK